MSTLKKQLEECRKKQREVFAEYSRKIESLIRGREKSMAVLFDEDSRLIDLIKSGTHKDKK